MVQRPGESSTFSISKLRDIILGCLLVGVAGYTAAMSSITSQLSESFGPQVRADLEWRVLRGARELARASDLGLAVGDAALIKEAFGVYANSGDVLAIVATDPKLALLAVQGQPPESVTQLFAGPAGSLRSEDQYLVSWADAQIEGAPVGKIALVVSTGRLNAARALLDRSANTALGGGLAALLLGCVVVIYFTRAVAQRDLQLSEHAANLERKVEERTRELDAVNRGMRLVLDHVAQGFITVDVHGVMAAERSAIVDQWFGPPGPRQTLSAFLAPHAAQYASWLAMGLEQLRDDVLPAELVLDQLPARFSSGAKTFDVTYTPIGEPQAPTGLLVIVSDVTELIAHERAEREQKELVALFQRISVDRAGVEEFLTEAAGLVAALRSETDPVVQQRLVHTLKGNCAIYGLDSYAQLAHAIESELVEHGTGLSDAQRDSLVRVWKEAMARVGQLLGGLRRDVIELDRSELEQVVARAQAGASAHELLAIFHEWFREPVERRLERLARQASAVARRVGKPEPKLEISGHGIRLEAEGFSAFWSSMVHVIRNAMDHGIESPEARALAGKPEVGTIAVEARREHGQLVISVRDDGAGVDWERLREKARAAGLPHTTANDLSEALFADGLSTREQTSEVSGRGVGMAALRQVVRDLGGEIRVSSARGVGSTFTFSFEERTVTMAAANQPRARLASLMPKFS